MYKKQLVTIFLFIFFSSYAQTEFITLWKPNINGTVTNAISFGGTGTSYTIQWEEIGYPQHSGVLNSVTSNSNSPITISFGPSLNTSPLQATYRLKVSNGSGLFYGFRAGTTTIGTFPNLQLVEVSQWGDTIWLQQFNGGFASCPNLNVTATDTPNLTQINNVSQMFFNCPSLIGNNSFSNWNTSTITNMSGMFDGATLFNQNVGSWNTANVTNFSSVFSRTSAFNQNISSWNTASGTNFSAMFAGAAAFNQPLNSWNTSNATNFRYVFSNATSFNQPLNNWDTSKVTDFEHMFEGASSFNQPIGNWDVSKVNYGPGFNMFNGAVHFDQDISTWNIQLQNFNGSSIFFGFKNSGLSCTNYNNFLIALNNNPTWASSTLTAGNIDATGLIYSTPQAIMARAQLVNKGFNITGDNYSTCVLSTIEASKQLKNQAYPNPTTGMINVEATVNENAYLYDTTGKIIKNITLSKGNNRIDLTEYPAGNYLLKGNSTSTKIIKK
ncbi:BspA family leucine-rich repeat surface protein [Chryseobacterium indologenes]|uniref:BspA family leucine-rich repeat surface protein n=1 Tax=Chryseobacterium indologenes TaxID=253 RepID=UPI000F4FB28A|nr:BspA family leucine-rich repeat surface protein [Chryseobacterium indologenes]AYZ35713.1 BspA family leucine-rich repeat surface protein [Chryseobacterium indologenes]MBF6644481.1 BspA family leucine-rich repeat surface protein [Chryseobacterium indologenes]MBU3050560.1 BspA family leucine-rich repeat surface protein [Chryseobacterium indologenes]MEB4760083.1 BspA family leucine-rich repeat surface protein [Chryseobacterium indologenes]QQQ71817.1 BspA family leucine-rich repeat surface prot